MSDNERTDPPLNNTDSPPNNIEERPWISTDNTVMPRHIAAILDNLIAIVVCILAAKAIPEHLPPLQLLVLVAVYLCYYLVLEGFTGRTIGKLMTGLAVVQTDGSPCTWKQCLIRTGFRVIEVNPALLGGIPAAISVIASSHHQRFGDIVAGTLVAPTGRIRRRRAEK